jgi:predicted PurR-regulated permease PerM
MASPSIEQDRFSKVFLLLLVVAISVLFIAMIRDFLTALLLAAILSGVAHPLYRRIRDCRAYRRLKGRETLASLTTLVIVTVVIVVPLLVFAGLVVAQAIDISQAVRPWVEEQIAQPSRLDRLLEGMPIYDYIAPYEDQILEKAGEVVTRTGGFLISKLAAVTRETAVFFFMLFVTLYAMFFFLIDGRRTLDRILYYLPLGPEEENRMVGKFISVSRATLKGTLVIGIVQGGLAGAAFAVVGIKGAAFWATVMAVLSIIPGVGTALIWIPAVVYLFVVGRPGAAIGLGIWCAVVVGTVDNLLRPWLVGRDTKMPDLLILLATLGGLVLFGAAGIIIGPIVAALFLTVWEIYGVAFSDYLPGVRRITAGDR